MSGPPAAAVEAELDSAERVAVAEVVAAEVVAAEVVAAADDEAAVAEGVDERLELLDPPQPPTTSDTIR